jgi:hypothetical protein
MLTVFPAMVVRVGAPAIALLQKIQGGFTEEVLVIRVIVVGELHLGLQHRLCLLQSVGGVSGEGGKGGGGIRGWLGNGCVRY